MSSCIRCGSPYASFGLYCSACQQVDQLKKQNQLLESNSSQEPGLLELMFTKLSSVQLLAIFGAIVAAVIIFWDSAPIVLARGLLDFYWFLIKHIFT